MNERGEYITAEFPEGLVQAAQYGDSVKAHAVYMSELYVELAKT